MRDHHIPVRPDGWEYSARTGDYFDQRKKETKVSYLVPRR